MKMAWKRVDDSPSNDVDCAPSLLFVEKGDEDFKFSLFLSFYIFFHTYRRQFKAEKTQKCDNHILKV